MSMFSRTDGRHLELRNRREEIKLLVLTAILSFLVGLIAGSVRSYDQGARDQRWQDELLLTTNGRVYLHEAWANSEFFRWFSNYSRTNTGGRP